MPVQNIPDVRQRVTTLRAEALALLQEVAERNGSASGANASVLGRLQHVANDLGAIQALVCEPAPLVPPPIV
jgi:hypothetical protein